MIRTRSFQFSCLITGSLAAGLVGCASPAKEGSTLVTTAGSPRASAAFPLSREEARAALATHLYHHGTGALLGTRPSLLEVERTQRSSDGPPADPTSISIEAVAIAPRQRIPGQDRALLWAKPFGWAVELARKGTGQLEYLGGTELAAEERATPTDAVQHTFTLAELLLAPPELKELTIERSSAKDVVLANLRKRIAWLTKPRSESPAPVIKGRSKAAIRARAKAKAAAKHTPVARQTLFICPVLPLMKEATAYWVETKQLVKVSAIFVEADPFVPRGEISLADQKDVAPTGFAPATPQAIPRDVALDTVYSCVVDGSRIEI